MRIFGILAIFGISAMPLSAAVDVLVSSSTVNLDGAVMTINGDLSESAGGYVQGKVTSGTRTNFSGFAGFTLSTPIDGSITRVTGSTYAEGNNEPANFERFYRISNTSSSVTADLTVEFVSSADNDERNGLTPPYYINSYNDSWSLWGNGSAASPVSASGVTIPAGESDWILTEENTIGVELMSFVATENQSMVVVEWQTAAEINTAGFNVFRSRESNNGFEKVNEQLISAQGHESKGAAYTYIDSPDSGGDIYYKLETVELNGAGYYSRHTSVQFNANVLSQSRQPMDFMLFQNYPNPFNPTTTIAYAVPTAENVKLVLFDMQGRMVRNLINNPHQPGTHRVVWDGRNDRGELAPSGIYVYQMSAGDYTDVKKMAMMK